MITSHVKENAVGASCSRPGVTEKIMESTIRKCTSFLLSILLNLNNVLAMKAECNHYFAFVIQVDLPSDGDTLLMVRLLSVFYMHVETDHVVKYVFVCILSAVKSD